MNQLKYLIFLVLLWPSLAFAAPPEVKAVLQSPVPKGTTTANLFSFDIYDAELFTSNGAPFSMAEPFALTLVYRYNFSADILAMASVREISRMEDVPMGRLRSLRDQLKNCFRDVQKGERVTGVGRTADVIEFYVNGDKTCALRQENLRERFFSIWLGSDTRDPDGAARLKGSS